MSSEKQFRQPCSPIARPIKFKHDHGQIIFQCSSETAANASISQTKPKNSSGLPHPHQEKHLKRSVLSFLCNHERRPSHVRIQVS